MPKMKSYIKQISSKKPVLSETKAGSKCYLSSQDKNLKSSFQRMCPIKGFSLIEMLVVLVIISTLIAITYPSYTKQIESTRRTEARTNLLDYAMRFEEYYSINYSYTGADTQYGLDSNPQTESGYYQLSASIDSSGDDYTITATAIGSQASDTPCATMVIDNVGQKTPTTCW